MTENSVTVSSTGAVTVKVIPAPQAELWIDDKTGVPPLQAWLSTPEPGWKVGTVQWRDVKVDMSAMGWRRLYVETAGDRAPAAEMGA